MGNITIDKINNINATTGFYRNYGFISGGNLISQCNKTGMYRIYNASDGIPPDTTPNDNDFYIHSYVAEDNKWIRLEVRNVRNSNVYEIMCIGGVWGNYQLLPNNDQIKSKMDLKVDKSGTKQLTDENFTLAEKNKLANVTTHFKGLFNSYTELTTDGCTTGDYAFIKGTPSASIWYFKDGVWRDSGSTLGGSMMKEIYDPNGIAKDTYNRANHIGTQPISTVTNLQTELDKKLNASDKTQVVDNFNSTSVVNALSANCGNVLMSTIHSIMTDSSSVDYGSSFGEFGGYTKLSSGLIIQFIQVWTDSTTATKEFNFPIPFPNKCYVLLATCDQGTSSGSGVDAVYTRVIDKTKASITHDYKNLSIGNLGHYVLAVGY